jgi:hypothetical protein
VVRYLKAEGFKQGQKAGGSKRRGAHQGAALRCAHIDGGTQQRNVFGPGFAHKPSGKIAAKAKVTEILSAGFVSLGLACGTN